MTGYDTFSRTELRQDSAPWVFFIAALVLFAPVIIWGLPHAVTAERLSPWGSDELAPLGPLAQIYNVVLRGASEFDPRYPLLPYLIQAAFIAPVVGWLKLTGGLPSFSTTYPFGLTDPVGSLWAMTLAARVSSLLMAAALPAIAYRTAARLWNQQTAVFAATFVLLIYPLTYYARTSNVDAGALLWTALGIMVFATCLRTRLTSARAAQLGLFAALATATKDQNYAIFIALGLAIGIVHIRDVRKASKAAAAQETGEGDTSRSEPLKAPPRGAIVVPLLTGLGTAVAVYAVASGLAINPQRFASHVHFITSHPGGQSGGSYFSTPATFAGYSSLAVRYARSLADALSWPMLGMAVIGAAYAAYRSPRTLLVALPVLTVFAGVIMPVRFVRIRFGMPAAYVIALFAAAGLAAIAGRAARGHGDERPSPAAVAWQRVRAGVAWLAFMGLAGWGIVRSVDLTQQMLNDSRDQLTIWFERNARAGDTVGYYGSALKLPPLAPDIRIQQGPHAQVYDRPPDAGMPEFIVIIPQQPFEGEHEWNLPDERYADLKAGAWNYDMMLSWQAPSLFANRPVSWVNPPVRLFVRRDVKQRLRDREPMLLLD